MASSLDKIDHIVVLMLENRSFDHLLGYLRLEEGQPVDGLTGAETNPDLDGAPVPVSPLTGTRFPTDLGHSSADVRVQLRGGNQGFVENYLHQSQHAAASFVMGYHDGAQVWAYDQLVRAFAVSDRWHSALPGPTIPNRLFAVAGQSDGDTDQPPHGVKIYKGVRSVFDCLDAGLAATPKSDRWGYYFHDLPMLSLLEQHIDELLPIGPHRIRKIGNFLDRAADGKLPAVSWIDPDFADFGKSNDDHPPKSDLYDGQLLVTSVYHALLDGKNGLFQKTLFVVLYDEHGGFFDHVSPPPSGDAPPFDRFGVRVPALLISPWIPAGMIDHVERSHASLLRTILNRFAPGETLTPRVTRAPDLGGLLSLAEPRSDAPRLAVPARPPAAMRAARRPGAVATTGTRTQAPTSLDNFLEAYRAELARRGVPMDAAGRAPKPKPRRTPASGPPARRARRTRSNPKAPRRRGATRGSKPRRGRR
jgi:phospholipase C